MAEQAQQQSFFGRMFNRGEYKPNTGNQNQQQQDNNQNNNQQQRQNTNNNQQNNQNQNNNTNTQQGSNEPDNRPTAIDAFADLWKQVDDKGSKAPVFELGDDVLNKSADQLDFLAGYDQSKIQKLRDRFGDDADTVFDLINTTNRKAYATAMKHGAKVTGTYLDARRPFDEKATSARVREHSVNSRVDAFEAAKKSPIIRENLRLISQRIANANPDAPEEWVAEQTKTYFTEMSNALNPVADVEQEKAAKAKAPGGQDFDWEVYGDGGKQDNKGQATFGL